MLQKSAALANEWRLGKVTDVFFFFKCWSHCLKFLLYVSLYFIKQNDQWQKHFKSEHHYRSYWWLNYFKLWQHYAAWTPFSFLALCFSRMGNKTILKQHRTHVSKGKFSISQDLMILLGKIKWRKYFKIKKALLKFNFYLFWKKYHSNNQKSLTNTALISVKGDRKKTSKERSELKIKCVISFVSSWRILEAVFSSRITGKV